MLFITSFSIAISTYFIFSIPFYGYAENGHNKTEFQEKGTWNLERRSFQVPFHKRELGTWNKFLFHPGTWNLELVPFAEELAQPWLPVGTYVWIGFIIHGQVLGTKYITNIFK